VANAASLGADEVIDYTKDDFTDTGQRYDVILDMPGNRGLLTMRRLLEPGATYVMIGGPKGRWISPVPTLFTIKLVSVFGRRRMTFGLERTSAEDLEQMADWMSTGQVRSVIDRNYKLAEAADAIAYIGEGHARGKVVVTI
jgi:NADPH:quinone reductase-like Zn-dependent oxidoreductase